MRPKNIPAGSTQIERDAIGNAESDPSTEDPYMLYYVHKKYVPITSQYVCAMGKWLADTVRIR